MRVVAAEILPLHLPFKTTFRHAGKLRRWSDSIVVKLYGEDGTTGYGEGVARPYVTGEQVAACVRHMQEVLWPAVAQADYPAPTAAGSPLDWLTRISTTLPDRPPPAGTIAWHGARCAFECALIDLLLKTHNLSLAKFLAPKRREVVYSGVIGLGSSFKTILTALYFRRLGVRDYKLKVSSESSLARRVRLVEAIIGKHARLRIDANGAFTAQAAPRLVNELAGASVACIEQPLARGSVRQLAHLQRAVPVPIMADESIVTASDAAALIKERACGYFNLRLAKNGGVVNTLKLAQVAAHAGVRIQLGCQVGETAILAALGRHVAAHLEQVEFVEGSYGPRLLVEDVSNTPVTFAKAGKAALLDGPGLGIVVNDCTVHKYAQRSLHLGERQ